MDSPKADCCNQAYQLFNIIVDSDRCSPNINGDQRWWYALKWSSCNSSVSIFIVWYYAIHMKIVQEIHIWHLSKTCFWNIFTIQLNCRKRSCWRQFRINIHDLLRLRSACSEHRATRSLHLAWSLAILQAPCQLNPSLPGLLWMYFAMSSSASPSFFCRLLAPSTLLYVLGVRCLLNLSAIFQHTWLNSFYLCYKTRTLHHCTPHICFFDRFIFIVYITQSRNIVSTTKPIHLRPTVPEFFREVMWQ